MHAHFRLLGQSTNILAARHDYEKTMEREVALRIFDRMRRYGSFGGRVDGDGCAEKECDTNAAAAAVVNNDNENDKTKKAIKFIKLIRWGKGEEEEVEGVWALQSELL